VVAWHYHPGHAFNVVKSGTLTLEDGCGRVLTLKPGQGFEAIDGRVHRPTNLGDTDVVVYDTFILREGKPTTVNLPERRCGPPNDSAECRNNGWRKFNHPRSFRNQQQCEFRSSAAAECCPLMTFETKGANLRHEFGNFNLRIIPN